jgi:hypothetical protein
VPSYEEIVSTYWKVVGIDDMFLPVLAKSLLLSLAGKEKRICVFSGVAASVELGDYLELDAKDVPVALAKLDTGFMMQADDPKP